MGVFFWGKCRVQLSRTSTAAFMVNLTDYDPSGVGHANGNLFGLPHTYETAQLIVIAVPWEVTVSYGAGTANAPSRILAASPQLDLFDFDNPTGWQQGIYLEPISPELLAKNQHYRQQAAKIIDRLESGGSLAPDLTGVLAEIDAAGEAVNQWLSEQCQKALSLGKRVAVIGGDHSSPLGYLRALADHYPDFGILHIDAHADLRDAYEGFKYSHASIMFNALQIPQITKLVQVGLRDICQDEVDLIDSSNNRIVAYFDTVIQQAQYAGCTWIDMCQNIVSNLPQQVYISFDVDGLDPKLCPATGTPVPGGLELEQAFCLIREIVKSDRQIIGFDLCEVGDADWDGNVGARIVYKLANLLDLSWRQSQSPSKA
jgi:agmatinase